MSSVPHPVPSRMAHNIAVLFGHADDTLRGLAARLRPSCWRATPPPDAERLAKALALAQDGHVVLEDDGSATVQGSGPQPYTVQGGRCDCPDASTRGVPCKHALATQIHQQAAALLMPSASPEPPQTATPPLPQPKRQARTRSSAAWDVHEAPLSTCLKLRLGPCEWTHTVRASDETELRARFSEFKTLVHDMAAA